MEAAWHRALGDPRCKGPPRSARQLHSDDICPTAPSDLAQRTWIRFARVEQIANRRASPEGPVWGS